MLSTAYIREWTVGYAVRYVAEIFTYVSIKTVRCLILPIFISERKISK